MIRRLRRSPIAAGFRQDGPEINGESQGMRKKSMLSDSRDFRLQTGML
jgi:hypothetical protein